MKTCAGLFAALCLCCVVPAALSEGQAGRALSAQVERLPVISVHRDGRYLQTEADEPFFWMGDTAWRLWRLNERELEVYLAQRARSGFTVIQGPVLHTVRANAGGAVPGPLSDLNPAWFEYVDHIIDRAAAHGLYVAPVLTWGSSADQFSAEGAATFGRYVGGRYRDRTNIAAFIIAGEFNQPKPHVDLWNAMAAGVLEGLEDTPRLITIHPMFYHGVRGQTSSHHFHDAEWLSFNMIQSSQRGDCSNDPDHDSYFGVHNWLLVEHDYALSPKKPVLDAEATYERMNTYHSKCDCPCATRSWDAFGVRRRAYWSVFAGAAGHTYGANGVWQFHLAGDDAQQTGARDTWDVAINYPGASDMGHLRRLIESRPFFERAPRQDILGNPRDEDVPTHVHATGGRDGRWCMVYVPQGARPVRIRTDQMTGEQFNAWWFNPGTGEATFVSTFEADRSRASYRFVTPLEGEDWVLVVDDVALSVGPPGRPLRTAGEK